MVAYDVEVTFLSHQLYVVIAKLLLMWPLLPLLCLCFCVCLFVCLFVVFVVAWRQLLSAFGVCIDIAFRGVVCSCLLLFPLALLLLTPLSKAPSNSIAPQVFDYEYTDAQVWFRFDLNKMTQYSYTNMLTRRIREIHILNT